MLLGCGKTICIVR